MTLHKRSPLRESLTEAAPFPLILKILPVCVYEGILRAIFDSRPGTLIVPPKTAI